MLITGEIGLWDDPELYHLVINTGKWKLEAAAQIIVNAVEQVESA